MADAAPTRDDLRAWKERHGLSFSDLGELGPWSARTWQAYLADPDLPSSRSIPPTMPLVMRHIEERLEGEAVG